MAHPAPQLVPVGALAIVPLPVIVVVRSKVGMKVAETERAALIVTLQALVPAQLPPQLPKA